MLATTKGFLRRVGLILAVCFPLLSTQAHAVSVTVNGTSYELSSVTGKFTANSALLQSQTWWGNAGLASDFASAAGDIGGGLFAYQPRPSPFPEVDNKVYGFFGVSNTATFAEQSNTYMTATASASSVPEINAGSLSQALLILFALWLVTRRGSASRVA